MAPLLSVPACNLAEFVSRLSAALMNVHDLPAAIRPRSRSFSSDVHRILGTTQSFLRLFAPSSGRHLDPSGRFPMRVFAMEFENSLDLSVKRSIYAHFSEQHWAPIFCGIDQHLNRQSPFRRIAFRLREFPNIIPGISQCSSRPLTGQRHGLIKRTIPGHCILRKRRKPPGDSSLPGEDSFPRYDVPGTGFKSSEPTFISSDKVSSATVL
jgi:hypothetical protein